jgi:hypothetical protein
VGEVGVQTDLASRLLAKIDEERRRVEKWTHYDPDEGGYYACPATRSEPYGDLKYGEENCDCGLAERRETALRMHGAHRQIVRDYQSALAAFETARKVLLHHGQQQATADTLGHVVRLLTDGYGIGDETQ